MRFIWCYLRVLMKHMLQKENQMPIEQELRTLAKIYQDKLSSQINARVAEMEEDDQSHFLIYRVLGVTDKEGKLIEMYQNKGRFLYKYAGSFLEEATKLCFKGTSINS